MTRSPADLSPERSREQSLRERQAPLKDLYRTTPSAAVVTLAAEGRLSDGVTCSVSTAKGMAVAGLHPATGGTGMELCSGDMLLEALVACAGVTLGAVSTSLGIELRDAQLRAEGDLDFKGTLAVDKGAPVGFTDIRLTIGLDTDASAEEQATLLKLTHRYCVVLQTLVASPTVTLTAA